MLYHNMDLNNQLITLAQKSDQILKYAAIIVYRNKIIGMGHNYLTVNSTNTLSCVFEVNKYSIHAEKDAIMSVKNKSLLPESRIIIIKIKNGKINVTGPCEMCQKLLNKYKISRVCTVFNDKIINCEEFK